MELIPRTVNLRTDQEVALVALSGRFQAQTGEVLSISRLAREIIDAGLPLVRQQYNERLQKAGQQ